MKTLEQDVHERDSFGWDYTGRIPEGDSIATSTWQVDAWLTVETPTFAGLVTSVWLSGGTPGSVYTVRNTVTTTAGRKLQRAFRLRITDDA